MRPEPVHFGAHASALVNASPVGQLLLDRELRVVAANPVAAALGPLAQSSVIGRPFGDVVPQLSQLGGVFRGVFETNLPFLNLELPGGGPEQRRRLIVSGFPVTDPEHRFVGVTIVDLPDSEPIDSMVRDRDELFRVAFERAAIGMLVLDWSNHGVRMNPAAERLYGYTPAEMERIGIQGITHPDDWAVDLEQFSRLMAGEIDHYQLAKRYVRKGGDIVWGDLVVSVARDAGGQPKLIISMVQDITERKRAEAERDQLLAERTQLLQQAQEGVRVRDVFLAMAAHELKTPLTPLRMEIEGMLAATQASLPDAAAERTHQRLSRVERQITRLERLVGDLLDVSSMAAGRLEVVRERVNLAEVAREVVARHHQQAQWSGYEITTRADAPVFGWWDRARLEQVATNLISNALKFGGGKPIEVATESTPTLARLTVRDHGVGIPAELHERVFEKFERIHSDRKHPGLGLGLWICRQLVTALGGQVRVESAPGSGSTFVVELPCGEA